MVKKLVFALLVCSVLSTSYAGASPTGGIGGRPANPDPDNPRTSSIFIFELGPNQSDTNQILLVNGGDTPRSVDIYPVDASISNTGEFTCEERAESRDTVGEWVSLSRESVELAPNSSTTIDFSIALPATVDVGEHNGCIAFQDQQAEPVVQGGVAVFTRQAVRVVVTVPGELQKNVDITSFTPHVEQSKQTYTTVVKNTGTVSSDTIISTRLTNLFGSPVYQYDGQRVVLPSGELTVAHTGSYASFWGGWYTASVEIAYDSRPGVFNVESPEHRTTKTAPGVSVFMMPSIYALLIYAGILILAIFAIWKVVRRRTTSGRSSLRLRNR